MNDRFRFRAWNKKIKEMRTVDHLYIKASEIYVTPNKLGDVCCWFFDDCELMQCTGLKDKNDKLIYEGDIIDYDCYGKYQIIFENGCYRTKLLEFFGTEGFMFNEYLLAEDSDPRSIVVIGNIYKNRKSIEVQGKSYD